MQKNGQNEERKSRLLACAEQNRAGRGRLLPLRLAAAAVLAAALLALFGCSAKETEVSETFFVMDTVASLRLIGDKEQAESLLKQAAALAQELETRWSRTLPDSSIYRLNDGETVVLDEETAALLAQAAALSVETGGAFTPTVSPLVELWNIGEADSPPSREEIAALLPLPSPDFLAQARAGQPFSLPEGCRLDLGGVAKGEAANRICALLRESSLRGALLVLGGQVSCVGTRADGEPWRIALRDPDGQQGETLAELRLTDLHIATSGDYERYLEFEGVRYCHILDPETGWPPETDLRSVTGVSSDGARADGLSTALFVMGLEPSLAFWREAGDFEAVFVTSDRRVIATEGLADCLSFSNGAGGYRFEFTS